MSWAWILGALGGLGALLLAFFKGHSIGQKKGVADTLQIVLKSRQQDLQRETELRTETEAIENEVESRQLVAPKLPTDTDLETLHKEVADL